MVVQGLCRACVCNKGLRSGSVDIRPACLSPANLDVFLSFHASHNNVGENELCERAAKTTSSQSRCLVLCSFLNSGAGHSYVCETHGRRPPQCFIPLRACFNSLMHSLPQWVGWLRRAWLNALEASLFKVYTWSLLIISIALQTMNRPTQGPCVGPLELT